AFHKDGATIVAHENIRIRMAAGTTNALNGNKTPPAEADALPTQTFMVGSTKVEVGGRVAEINHTYTSHTDGDTWAYFRDANELALGDSCTRNYPNLDWGSGGTIDGMVAANDRYLKTANDQTKVVPGHGPLATKANIVEFREMLAAARDRVKKLYDEGKSEQD